MATKKPAKAKTMAAAAGGGGKTKATAKPPSKGRKGC